jgi:hypothetical protein
MGLAREQGGQVDEDHDRRVDPAEGLLYGLPVVADGLQLAHYSIIRSKKARFLGLRSHVHVVAGLGESSAPHDHTVAEQVNVLGNTNTNGWG